MFHAAHGYERTAAPEVKEPGSTRTAGAATAATAASSGLRSAPQTARRTTARDAYFDNAKYLAIVLVAVAHAWEPVMEGSRATRALYMVIYTFHMPAFIVISGYFSRSYQGKPHQLRRLLTGIALPYVVFEVAYSLFARYGNDDPEQPVSLLDPYYLTWFLAALFIWRLTTPLWRIVRWPISTALVIGALATVTPDIGADLNLARVLQFLPFFVIGLSMKPEHFQMLRRREVRLLTVPVLAMALVTAYWVAPRMDLGWFYRSSSVQELGRPWWSGLLVIIAFFGCALLLSAAFLALVPGRRAWFTVLGTGTICGYLLHGFVIKAADFWGLFDSNQWLGSPAGLVVVTVCATGMVTLLCSPPVRRGLKPVTEPDMKWAFRQDSAEPGTSR